MDWFLYMVRCRNGQIYTGISTNVERRFAEHQAGKGAKYLRGKSPLKLVYQKKIGSHSEALKEEIVMKNMSKSDKEEVIRKAN
ncbi:MAG: GIY-YIG nuclease family protein [Mariprofundus sp.]|nr:GIY-YIG nuclease family protein [Mariprofundus sp.]